MTLFNPDSWLDVIAYAVFGAPALIAAIATLRHAKRDRPLRDKVNEIHDQTVNDHGGDTDKNLRVQIDRLETAVAEGFRSLGEQLHHERVERDRLSGRIDLHERRYHTEPFG